MPKKEDTKKISKGKGTAGSRPCSPDRELVNGVGGGRPKAPVGRKRKANAMDKSGDEVKQEKDVLCRLYVFFCSFSYVPVNSKPPIPPGKPWGI